jgi:hypothetical protein
MEIELVNQWEKPKESMKRGNCAVVMNTTAVQDFFMDTGRFKEKKGRALGKTHRVFLSSGRNRGVKFEM